MSFVDRLPQPLLEDIVAGRSLPLVGAGLSRDARAPGGEALPLWGELGEMLVEQMREYPGNSREPLEVMPPIPMNSGVSV